MILSDMKLRLLAVAFCLAGFSTAASAAGGAIRVMCLGDSITSGDDSHASYRWPLWQMFVTGGYNFDLVGPFTTGGPNGVPNPEAGQVVDGQTFDLYHAGVWGIHSIQIVDEWPGPYLGYHPDILLLHLGTNDPVDANGNPTWTLNNLTVIINGLRAENPNLVILLAQIIPTNAPDPWAIALNAAIPAFAASLTSPQSPIVVVDQYDGFDPSIYPDLTGRTDDPNGMLSFDGVHPNPAGEQWMATNWLKAMLPYLGGYAGPPATTPVVNSATTLACSTGQTCTYQITGTNGPTSFGATGLPSGLTFNTLNGVIGGSSMTAGTIPIAISASNTAGTGSATLLLTLAAPVGSATISQQPVNQTVNLGQSATFSVTASGPGPLSYAWYVNGNAINGATSPTYITPPTALTDNGSQFFVAVTNPAGTINSTTATLQVMGPPVITSASAAIGQIGQPFSYSITASNNPTSFPLLSGPLPAGLSENTQTGMITGTPTSSGSFSDTIYAQNGVGPGSATLAITIEPSGVVPANFSSAYNVMGISMDGVPFTGGGLDMAGYAYSEVLLGAVQTIGGVGFSMGPANAPDAMSSITAPLPAGQFGTLKMLATGVNGNQPSQTFTVNYSDGTQSSFTQSLSDWFTPQGYTGETIAVTNSYRDFSAGTLDARTFMLYEYSFNLTAGKTVSSIVLPNNRNVVVLAMTLLAPSSPVTPSASFTLSDTTNAISAVQGGSGSTSISVVPVNGFSGSVALAVSGLPAGVTGSFNPNSTTGSSTLTLTAGTTAATGTTNVTVTGTSGSLTASTTISVTVTAASSPGLTGSPASGTVFVSLVSAYNITGVVGDGAPFTGGGLDGAGYAYSEALLGGSQTVGGVVFSIGPMDLPDAVSSATVPLPAGQFATLKILATGVNGNQPSQNFTVNYTDGTQSAFTQSLSDWFTPQGFGGETVAVTSPYRDASNGTEDGRTFRLYEYSFNLASGKTVSSIVLPNNRNVVVLAMTLVDPVVMSPPTTVNLSLDYNIAGLASDGVPFSGSGMDGDGYSYSGTVLGSSQTIGGVAFAIGPATVADVVSSTTVPLPAGQFGTLYLLATGVNGNQGSQSFTVNYSDGTQSTFMQSLSDWFTPQNYAGETIAVSASHRDMSSGALDQRAFMVYEYSFSLVAGKTVTSIVLPNNRNVVVLAITLGD
jgi:lysophospholipase L1-like esterase